MSLQIRWLGMLVLILGLASVYFLKGKKTVEPNESSTILLPQLSANTEYLSEIVIESGADDKFSIRQVKGDWVVYMGHDGKQQYPANTTMLKAFMQSLASAQKREAKTLNPKHHAILGVASLDVADNYSTRISIFSNLQSWSLLVGKAATNGVGSYVRYPGDNQVWLIDQAITLPLSKIGWLEQSIISFRDIVKVERFDEQNNWRIEKLNGTEFEFYPNEENLALRYSTILENYIASWTVLTFSDLIWMDEQVTQTLPAPMTQFQIEDKTGLMASLSLYHYKDKFWVNCSGCHAAIDTSNWLLELTTFSLTQIDKAQTDFFVVSDS